mgnify:FL=1
MNATMRLTLGAACAAIATLTATPALAGKDLDAV